MSSPHRHTSPNQCYVTPPSASALGTGSTRRCAGTGSSPYGASAWRRGQLALGGPDRSFLRAVLVCTPNTDSREADAMRKLSFGMNLSLDGYIAAPGDDLGWSVPSDELFQWWSDRVGATGLALYGRKLWETMSSHWPTADQQPGATPAAIEFARRRPRPPRGRLPPPPAAGATCRRWCSPRRPARSTGTPVWSRATRSPRSPGSRPTTAAPWTSAVPHSPRRPCGPG